jgi:PAS domain-containing protein
MTFSFLGKVAVLALVGVAVTFVLDPLDPTTVSTPFCLGIILMALSLRQSTSLVVALSLFYSFLTIYALIRFHQNFIATGHTTAHPYFWLFQRIGLFLVVCSMATYLAYYRTATERTLTHLQDILGKLPAPVVISDSTGVVIYTNDALNSVFKRAHTDVIGQRYIELFMADIQEGKAMRYYIEIFNRHAQGVHEIGVRPFSGAILMTARLICVGAGQSRVMVTLLSDREETPLEVVSGRRELA